MIRGKRIFFLFLDFELSIFVGKVVYIVVVNIIDIIVYYLRIRVRNFISKFIF